MRLREEVLRAGRQHRAASLENRKRAREGSERSRGEDTGGREQSKEEGHGAAGETEQLRRSL